MRILVIIGILFVSNLSFIEKKYDFNTLVEFKSDESNQIYFFLFNEDIDDYYLSIYTDLNDKKKAVINDKKNLKKHHFEIIDLNFEYTHSEEYLSKQKNKTFTEYYFEVSEQEIDSTTKSLKFYRFKNLNNKKLQNAIDLVHEQSVIRVDEKFLNHFCHGYFSNTNFEYLFPLPNKITVYKNNNNIETFQLTKLERIGLKINFTEQ